MISMEEKQCRPEVSHAIWVSTLRGGAVTRVLNWMGWRRRWDYGLPCSEVPTVKRPIRWQNFTMSDLFQKASCPDERREDRSNSPWGDEDRARDNASPNVEEEKRIGVIIDEMSDTGEVGLYAFDD